MTIISPAKEFWSFTVQKRFGQPDSFGELVLGWTRFGQTDIKAAVYQRQQKRGNFWTKTNKIKLGTIYRKLHYYYPPNPRTELQQSNRAKMAEAILAWRNLTSEQKSVYNEIAKFEKFSGYNKFISDWIKSH